MTELRQPIVSLLGHVDHGKTTLLDRITGAARAAREAGGITQHIGAFELPGDTVRKLCAGLLATERFRLPGLLFVDTPGHRSFETLRRRGGALADLAVVVIDAKEGAMPQTRESIQILRHEKTPFAVALTKIDLLPAYRRPTGPVRLAELLSKGTGEFPRAVDERVYATAEALHELGFSAERFDRVSDFTRNVGIVPVSARHGVGIAELLALLVGLAQRFLSEELTQKDVPGEATILERSDEKGVGPVGQVIVYRGSLCVGDAIVATGRVEPFASRIRAIYRPGPLAAARGARVGRLQSVDRATAAAGVYLSAPGIEEAMPGGLLKVVRNPHEEAEVREELARDRASIAEIAPSGVAVFADTLGGLEALAFECREANVPIHEAGVGPVGRSTVLRMATVKEPTHRAVLAFNVPILPDAEATADGASVRLFRGDVMYKILEEFRAWQEQRAAEIRAERRQAVTAPARVEILRGFVFRASKPAIVGVKVLAGTLRTGVRLEKPDGTEVGVVKSLRRQEEALSEAPAGSEVAAAIDGAVIGRNLKEGDVLVVHLTEAAVRRLRDEPLSPAERALVEETIERHRRTDPFWAR